MAGPDPAVIFAPILAVVVFLLLVGCCIGGGEATRSSRAVQIYQPETVGLEAGLDMRGRHRGQRPEDLESRLAALENISSPAAGNGLAYIVTPVDTRTTNLRQPLPARTANRSELERRIAALEVRSALAQTPVQVGGPKDEVLPPYSR